VKKYSPAFVLLISFLIVLFSCKKINEATTLGGDLIPPVDNVNTFEVALDAVTKNSLTPDSTQVLYTDQVSLGDINDPEFGHVHANFDFNVSAPAYGSYPFLPRRDSLPAIDSVVLSLRYTGAYGDTMSNGVQTISVYEIPYSGPGTGLRSDTLYRYNDPASDFSGSLLGSATYTINRLGVDSVTIANPGVTYKTLNTVRVQLNNSLGNKLIQMDTTGYKSDSVFHTLFNGLSVKSSNTGNALSYFSLSDTATKLVVYYKYNHNGKDTTAIVEYHHSGSGQSNYVNVTPGNNWANSLNNANDDKVYIQSAPSGSYAGIRIPGLDTFSNKVIHRAEIIATQIPSTLNDPFTPPARLILDRIHHNTIDTAFVLQNDLTVGSDLSVDWTTFGGNYSYGQYRFNITRYVQGIVTRHESNDSLRIYAPLRTYLFDPALSIKVPIQVVSKIANGRVILAGGNYPTNPAIRLRLRIVYSNL